MRNTADRDGAPTNLGGSRRPGGVRSAVRTLSVLSVFIKAPEMSLEAISLEAGLPKSTAHRLLSTLVETGYVETGSQTGSYRLGVRTAVIGSVAIRSRRPKEDVHRVLEKLRVETDETIGLSVLHQRSVVVLDKVDSLHPLRFDLGVGASAPAHATSSGKVLLAELSDAELDRLYRGHPLPKFTPNTSGSLPDLKTRLEQVRQQGYSVDDEELFHGLRCVSVAVRDAEEQAEFALAVSAPAARFSLDRAQSLVGLLRRAAGDIMAATNLTR